MCGRIWRLIADARHREMKANVYEMVEDAQLERCLRSDCASWPGATWSRKWLCLACLNRNVVPDLLPLPVYVAMQRTPAIGR
jgi:hypothetical protein